MGYIDKNLMTGEDIIYKANIHWFIFVPGVVIFAIGIYLFTLDVEGGTGPVLGFIAILIAIFSLIKALITKITIELAVTSKRVIAKVGLIRRNTVELNHSKVESFNIDQSVFGRIFGFGTIIVNGTGGGKTPIPSIDSPLDFRREAMQTLMLYNKHKCPNKPIKIARKNRVLGPPNCGGPLLNRYVQRKLNE